MAHVRRGGFVPLRDYAVIGDGRSAALVAADGSVDWLGMPDLDSPSVFAAVLDPARGGRFLLEPEEPFTAARRYLPGTNVLETTFTTGRGSVPVTDALTLEDGGALGPMRELQRRLDGLSGTVPLRWSVRPRLAYGAHRPRITRRYGVPVVVTGGDALAVCAWDAGEPECADGAISGRLDLGRGGGPCWRSRSRTRNRSSCRPVPNATRAWSTPSPPGRAGRGNARTTDRGGTPSSAAPWRSSSSSSRPRGRSPPR